MLMKNGSKHLVYFSECVSGKLFDDCTGNDNGVINFFSETSGSLLILLFVLHVLLPIKLKYAFRTVTWTPAEYTACYFCWHHILKKKKWEPCLFFGYS